VSFDPGPYAEHYRAENEEERRRTRARYEAALEEARDLARRIKEKDGAVRGVILFGSMAEGVPRNPDFDIDLALDGGDAYRAMDITDESPYEVDVVELRLLPPHVRKRILEKGIALP
jgi:predicted nucleotidyltransferase